MLSYSESGVFSSFSFFITDGVAGENAPQQDEIKNIIESGGGSWIHGENELEEFFQQKKIISATASSSSITTKNINTVKISKTAKSSNDLDSLISSTNVTDGKNIENNSNKLIVISSEKALKGVSTTIKSILKNVLKLNFLAGDGIFCLEILFLGVLRQRVCFEEINRLDCSFLDFVDNDDADEISVKKAAIRKSKK